MVNLLILNGQRWLIVGVNGGLKMVLVNGWFIDGELVVQKQQLIDIGQRWLVVVD